MVGERELVIPGHQGARRFSQSQLGIHSQRPIGIKLFSPASINIHKYIS